MISLFFNIETKNLTSKLQYVFERAKLVLAPLLRKFWSTKAIETFVSIQGVEGWSWSDVAPYFKKVEGCTFKCNTDIRGTSGPMKLTKPKEKSHFVSAVLKAAEQMGYPITE